LILPTSIVCSSRCPARSPQSPSRSAKQPASHASIRSREHDRARSSPIDPKPAIGTDGSTWSSTARKAARSVDRLARTASPRAALAHAYAVTGKTDAARKILGELAEGSKGMAGQTYDVAAVHVGLRDAYAAFTWLDRAASERSYTLTYIYSDPRMDPLRSDPRFQALLRKMNFPEK